MQVDLAMLEPPAWLADEPEITAMLHAVVDRFDLQRGSDRTRDLSFPAATALPSLATNDARADDVWSLVQALAELPLLKIKHGTRSAFDHDWVNARLAFPSSSEDTLRAWLNRAPAARAIDEWREAVQQHAHRFGGAIELLKSRRIDIPGRTAAEVTAALANIGAISGPITLRQLSSRVLWGNSKLLDQRGDLICGLFPNLQIRERPIVVCAHLPNEYTGVLFIENQDTYAAAIRSIHPCVRNLAVVYASGFRSSATRIRSRDGAILHFTGPAAGAHAPAFERWWFGESDAHMEIWFWGDLDFAGMQILKTLRVRFESTGAWRPGYDALLPLAGSASPNLSDRKEQIDPLATGDGYADDTLLPAIRLRGFVDQESVTFL